MREVVGKTSFERLKSCLPFYALVGMDLATKVPTYTFSYTFFYLFELFSLSLLLRNK